MSTQFAARQLAKKMRLEANLQPKLTSFFRDINRTVKAVIKSTGQIASLKEFKQDLVELLSIHYDRTSKAFQGDVAPSLTKDLNTHYQIKQNEAERLIEESDEIIDEALLSIIALRAATQTDFILDTVEKELQTASEKATIDAAMDGATLTRNQRANIVADDFSGRIPGKVENIATYETNAMAEETKLVEAQTIVDSSVIVSGIVASIAMRKTWNAILDSKTRDSHVLADLQNKSVIEPFIVQGQRLRVPGDTSLGATLDNVIGCRCSASYGLGRVE